MDTPGMSLRLSTLKYIALSVNDYPKMLFEIDSDPEFLILILNEVDYFLTFREGLDHS